MAAGSTAAVTEKMAACQTELPEDSLLPEDSFEETFCTQWATNSSVKIGQRVIYSKQKGKKIVQGTVSFIGEIFGSTINASSNEGVWVGIHLDDAEGKHNGSLNGKKFFECPAMHGLFVRAGSLRVSRYDMDAMEGHGVRTRSMSLQHNQVNRDLIPKHAAAMNESFIMPEVTQIMDAFNRGDVTDAPTTTADEALQRFEATIAAGNIDQLMGRPVRVNKDVAEGVTQATIAAKIYQSLGMLAQVEDGVAEKVTQIVRGVEIAPRKEDSDTSVDGVDESATTVGHIQLGTAVSAIMNVFGGAASSGTASAQYRPTQTHGPNEAEGTFHCITVMDPYKTKSLEELRWEDYQANRRPGAAGVPATPAVAVPEKISNSEEREITYIIQLINHMMEVNANTLAPSVLVFEQSNLGIEAKRKISDAIVEKMLERVENFKLIVGNYGVQNPVMRSTAGTVRPVQDVVPETMPPPKLNGTQALVVTSGVQDLASAGQKFQEIIVKFKTDVGDCLRSINAAECTQEQKRQQIEEPKIDINRILKQVKASFRPAVLDATSSAASNAELSSVTSVTSSASSNVVAVPMVASAVEIPVRAVQQLNARGRKVTFAEAARTSVEPAPLATIRVTIPAKKIVTKADRSNLNGDAVHVGLSGANSAGLGSRSRTGSDNANLGGSGMRLKAMTGTVAFLYGVRGFIKSDGEKEDFFFWNNFNGINRGDKVSFQFDLQALKKETHHKRKAMFVVPGTDVHVVPRQRANGIEPGTDLRNVLIQQRDTTAAHPCNGDNTNNGGLVLGTRVKILGLTRGTHNNNKEGKISRIWAEDSQCCIITPDDGSEPVKVNVCNMAFINSLNPNPITISAKPSDTIAAHPDSAAIPPSNVAEMLRKVMEDNADMKRELELLKSRQTGHTGPA